MSDDDRPVTEDGQPVTDDGQAGARSNGTADTSASGDDGVDDPGDVPLVEKVAMASSVLLTVSLFAFATWQAFTGAGVAAPAVDVIDARTAPDGDVIYTVELRNPGDVGLTRATVVAGCTDPPIRLSFESVPSGGRRVGTVVCPPGTAEPRLSVESWIHQ